MMTPAHCDQSPPLKEITTLRTKEKQLLQAIAIAIANQH
jgi:hypothetical protein